MTTSNALSALKAATDPEKFRGVTIPMAQDRSEIETLANLSDSSSDWGSDGGDC